MPRFATRLRRASAALVILALGLAGALVAAPSANAATFTVTSSANAGPGTLRQAILDANSVLFPGVDTISFAPAVTSINLAATIVVTEAVNLYGPGAANLMITRNGDFEMFEFDMAAAGQSVGIDGIYFDGGLGTSQRGFDFLDINPVANLTISDSEFAVFQTSVRGGAINIEELTGNFILVDTDFHDNASLANVSIASIYAEDIDSGFVSIGNCNFYGNSGESGSGLEIMFSSTDVTIDDSSFTDNQASNAGAGAFLYGLDSVTIRDTTFRNDDVSSNSAGALYVSVVSGSVSLEDTTFADSDTFSGNGGAATITSVNGLEIIDSTFTNNTTVADGGAVWAALTGSTTVRGSTFSQNTAANNGGALHFDDLDDELAVTGNSFTSNSAGAAGGAIYFDTVDAQVDITNNTFEGNQASGSSGGAVRADFVANPLLLFSDTFTGNVSTSPGAAASVSVGTIETGGTVAVANSTFLEDNATTGVVLAVQTELQTSAQLFVVSSTVVGNGAVSAESNDGFILVSDSIIDGDGTSGAFDPFFVNTGDNVGLEWSILTTALNVVFTDAGAGNQFSANPQLGPLQNHGGATETMALLSGSPAINAGDPTYGFGFTEDQRGGAFARIVSGRIDIGAFEVQLATLAATGTDISPLVPISGALLLMIGVMLLVLVRRRRVTFPG